MIYWFIKNWKIFLDILLVVGAILLFTFWDPFGIFTNAKTKATANLVSGVRDMGELVTAEYYGEVISSWKEYKLTEFPDDTLDYYAGQSFIQLKYDLENIKNDRIKIKDPARYVKLSGNTQGEFIAFIAYSFGMAKLKNIYDLKNENLKSDWYNRVYKYLIKDLKQQEKRFIKEFKKSKEAADAKYTAYLNEVPDFLAGYHSFYRHLKEKNLDLRKNRKKNIIFIGRGSVKAGFRFDQLDESNFFYDEDQKIVHFYGMKPEVLDTDINPWFIPERKVKGFELVDYSGKVNFEDAKLVKKKCKEKLHSQAQKAGIIQQAEQNGKEALQNFFSILLNEPKLQVSFHTHPFDHIYAVMAADSLISMNEAIFIDSLYNAQLRNIDFLQLAGVSNKSEYHLKLFVQRLKKLNFYSTEYPFSYYSLPVAKLLSDSLHLSRSDIDRLRILRDVVTASEDGRSIETRVTSSHPIWFENADFQAEFNSTLSLVKNEVESYEDYQLKMEGQAILKDATIQIVDSVRIDGTIWVRYYDKNYIEQMENELSDLKYAPDLSELSSLLALDSMSFFQICQAIPYKTENAQKLSQAEHEAIWKVLKTKRKYQQDMRPIQSLTANLQGFIDRLKKQ